MTTRIILVDDHKIMRTGLKRLLEDQPNLFVVGEAEDGRQAVRLAIKLSPNLVIMDVTMPGLNGIDATMQMVRDVRGIGIIALSMHRDVRYVVDMVKAGAKAYLLKDCDFDELIHAIRIVDSGGTYLSPEVSGAIIQGLTSRHQPSASGKKSHTLTPREREVVQLLAEGCSGRDIADQLCVSVKTVETHRQNIMYKLKFRSLADLTKFALREGLTSLDG